MSVIDESLRERKKRRTREALIQVSSRLFREHGYDQTTLGEIARAAEVSVPTLLLYFDSKERLALAPEYDFFEKFRGSVTDAERRLDVLHLWRSHVEEGARIYTSNRSRALRRLKFEQSSAVLARAQLTLNFHYQQVLADGLGVDFGTEPSIDLTTQLLATVLAFGNATVVRQWATRGGVEGLETEVLAVVDFAMSRFPQPGATDLVAAPPPATSSDMSPSSTPRQPSQRHHASAETVQTPGRRRPTR